MEKFRHVFPSSLQLLSLTIVFFWYQLCVCVGIFSDCSIWVHSFTDWPGLALGNQGWAWPYGFTAVSWFSSKCLCECWRFEQCSLDLERVRSCWISLQCIKLLKVSSKPLPPFPWHCLSFCIVLIFSLWSWLLIISMVVGCIRHSWQQEMIHLLT